MNPEIARRVAEVRCNSTHGASWLSREAVSVIRLAVESSSAETVAEFLEELTLVAAELMRSRPSMASIINSVSRLMQQVSEKSEVKGDLSSLKGFALSSAAEFVRRSEEAVLKAAEQAAMLIEDKDRVLTSSSSSTICTAFRIAKEGGKHIHVVAAESRSAGGQAYGQYTARELEAGGISVEVIPDEVIKRYIRGVNMVLVGADSILGDGSLINGLPTCEVALAAREADRPFYSVCEIAKFDVRSKSPELEEGFDLTPPNLITGIVTEEGIIEPSRVIDQVRKWGLDPELIIRGEADTTI